MNTELTILILVSFGASWLTFFSGFGLGTLLTPVFYMLFKGDLALAVASTAIVHFLNNVFKFALMQKSVDWKVAGPFGLAAIPAAFAGAFLLTYFEDFLLFTWHLGAVEMNVMLMNLIFGLVLIGFALIEIVPKWSLAFAKKSLWVGGFISGFFGGLSGHQGALRTAFLIRYNLDKSVFVATGIVIALIVDIVRTSVYFSDYDFNTLGDGWVLIAASLGAALLGAITGRFFLKKMNIHFLTTFISIMMIVFGLALISGALGLVK